MRRRELLAATAAAVLAGPAAATAAPRRDGDVLEDLVALEDAAALAYEAAPVAIGLDLAAHETDHAAALRTDLEALTRPIPGRPEDVAELDGEARRLVAADDRLDAAIALEAALIAAYRGALLELEEPGLLETVGSILASHAQHRAVLLRAAGRDPLA